MYNNYYPKKNNIFIYIIIAVISFVLGWQATFYGILGQNSHTENKAGINKTENEENSENLESSNKIDLDLFWTVWSEIEKKYVDETAIDSEIMTYGAIKGIAESLNDPYTVFMDPKESKEFNESLEGTLEGIGAELTVEDKKLIVVSPLKDSPAQKAGLLPGDTILKINDKFAADMSLFDAIMSIRGKKGTSVTLTIIRKDVADPFEVSIVRDSINVDSVTFEEFDNKIFYISINQFNDKTLEQFDKAVSDIVLKEPKGMIIDLRYNGGGYLDIAVDILSYILPSKTKVLEVHQRNGENDEMETIGTPRLPQVPLVVLVNEGSASASEIVAGAIQDLKRGVVMGTKTFGKGSVQEVETFKDGSSIRMTVAKWFTPNGRTVDKTGLNPDINVEQNEKDAEKKIDTQKEAAIKYLENLSK